MPEYAIPLAIVTTDLSSCECQPWVVPSSKLKVPGSRAGISATSAISVTGSGVSGTDVGSAVGAITISGRDAAVGSGGVIAAVDVSVMLQADKKKQR